MIKVNRLDIFNVITDQVCSNTRVPTQVNTSLTRVNTNQHESGTNQHESTRVNTSLTRVTRVRHKSTRINQVKKCYR